MEALSSLGIDWKSLIAQIVNFLILLFVLSKLLYKPLVEMLDQRKKGIAKGVADAKAAEARLLQVEEEAKEKIKGAVENANEIVEKASKEATKQATTIIEDAKKKSFQIIEKANESAQKRQNEIMREVKKDLADIVETAIIKITSKQPAKESIDQAIKELN